MTSYGIHKMTMCFERDDAENLLKEAHFNILSFYLMGKEIRSNFCVFNIAAIEVLKNKRIRGRRREVLEKFVGRIAAMRFSGELLMEEELPCLDLVNEPS